MESPFDRPPIMMQKYSQQEFLTKLRQHIHRGYMPTSESEGFHSKPEYLNSHDNTHFLNSVMAYSTYPGFYVNMGPPSLIYNASEREQIHACLPIEDLYLITALTDLKTWVGSFDKEGEPHVWEWPEERDLALNRVIVNEVFNYL